MDDVDERVLPGRFGRSRTTDSCNTLLKTVKFQSNGFHAGMGCRRMSYSLQKATAMIP